jgi:pantetheine-phosphate adenylyltransferase
MTRIAVFPGSFDPITLGHESIIQRAYSLFDTIIIGIGENPEKSGYFSLETRIQWINTLFQGDDRIRVMAYTGLTVDFCRQNGARFILRGLRTSADFEFERGIGLMNKVLVPGIETVFLMTAPEYVAISSSIVRNIHQNGGDIRPFLPSGIREMLP